MKVFGLSLFLLLAPVVASASSSFCSMHMAAIADIEDKILNATNVVVRQSMLRNLCAITTQRKIHRDCHSCVECQDVIKEVRQIYCN